MPSGLRKAEVFNLQMMSNKQLEVRVTRTEPSGMNLLAGREKTLADTTGQRSVLYLNLIHKQLNIKLPPSLHHFLGSLRNSLPLDESILQHLYYCFSHPPLPPHLAKPSRLSLPEMSQVIEHGLFVEFIFEGIHNDGAIHGIVHPVRTPFHVESQVPVNPPGDEVVEILQRPKASMALPVVLQPNHPSLCIPGGGGETFLG